MTSVRWLTPIGLMAAPWAASAARTRTHGKIHSNVRFSMTPPGTQRSSDRGEESVSDPAPVAVDYSSPARAGTAAPARAGAAHRSRQNFPVTTCHCEFLLAGLPLLVRKTLLLPSTHR